MIACIVIIASVIFVLLVCIPREAHAYTVRFGPLGPCHEIITGKAIDLLEKEAKIRNLPHWEEIRVYRQKLMEGARDEDFLPDKPSTESVPEEDRVRMMHYYHPFSQSSLPDSLYDDQAKAEMQRKIPGLRVSAIQRAQEHETMLMRAYESGNFEKVYWYLGRLCHLIQDMTVPAHVHGDVHTTSNEDDFEKQVDIYARTGRMRNFSISNHYFMKIYRCYRKKQHLNFADLLPQYMHNTAKHTFIRSLSAYDREYNDTQRPSQNFMFKMDTDQPGKLEFIEDKNKIRLQEHSGDFRYCPEKQGYVYIRKVSNVVPYYWRESNKINLSLWDLYYKYFVGYAINVTAAMLMLWYEMIPRLETVLDTGGAETEEPFCHKTFSVSNRGGIKEKIVIDLDGIPSYITPILRLKKRPLRKDLRNATRFELDLDPGETANIKIEMTGNPE